VQSGVVAAAVPPTPSVLHRVVAILVPAIPIVAIRCAGDLVLRVINAANRDHLALLDNCASLRREGFRLSLADDDSRFTPHNLNPIAPLLERSNGYVRGVDLDLGLAPLQDRQIEDAFLDLNLELRAGQVRQLDFGAVTQANRVGVVELDLSARLRARGNRVAAHQRRVDRQGHPVSGVPPLAGDVAMNQADSRHSRLRLCGLHRTGGPY
jgi:hypothetical protein